MELYTLNVDFLFLSVKMKSKDVCKRPYGILYNLVILIDMNVKSTQVNQNEYR